MSPQAALIIATVLLTALAAGFGATYAEQHARAVGGSDMLAVTYVSANS